MTTAIVISKRASLALATAAALIAAAFTLVATATAPAATASASGSPQSAAACVPGVKKINGVSARTFCGPAKATVKMSGTTISYRGGKCSKSLGLFSVNIGTVVLGNLRNKPEYFGVTASAKAGVQTRQGVSVVHARQKPGDHRHGHAQGRAQGRHLLGQGVRLVEDHLRLVHLLNLSHRARSPSGGRAGSRATTSIDHTDFLSKRPEAAQAGPAVPDQAAGGGKTRGRDQPSRPTKSW